VEQIIALDIWALATAAPCAVCWIIGDFVGMRREAAKNILQERSTSIDAGFAIESRESKNADAKRGRGRGRGRPAIAVQAGVKAQASFLTITADPFLNMPSLRDLENEIADIRAGELLWGDPLIPPEERALDSTTLKVLKHYQSAIRDLATLEVHPDHPRRTGAMHSEGR